MPTLSKTLVQTATALALASGLIGSVALDPLATKLSRTSSLKDVRRSEIVEYNGKKFELAGSSNGRICTVYAYALRRDGKAETKKVPTVPILADSAANVTALTHICENAEPLIPY